VIYLARGGRACGRARRVGCALGCADGLVSRGVHEEVLVVVQPMPRARCSSRAISGRCGSRPVPVSLSWEGGGKSSQPAHGGAARCRPAGAWRDHRGRSSLLGSGPVRPSAEDRAYFSWCGYRDPPEAASEPPATRASQVGGATNCRAVSRHDDEVPRTLAVRRACARETAGNAQEGLVRHRPHHRDRPSCPSRCLEGTGGCSRQVNRGSGEATDPRDRLLRADHR